MNLLHLDFEVRSMLELSGKKSRGLHNYFLHESTKPLILGYKFPYDKEPRVWLPHEGPMSDELLDALRNPNQDLVAFNSGYERGALRHLLGIEVPADRFYDPQVSARYLSMPGSLDDVGQILGLPQELAKDKRGEQLIDLFSKPHKQKKKKGEPDVWYFNDWASHPKEFAEFVEYCKQDIRAEEEVLRRETLLQAFPLPPMERKIWVLD